MSAPASVAIGGDTRVDAVFNGHLDHISQKLWEYAISRPTTRAKDRTVASLRERLAKGPILDRAERVSVGGVFYPAVLMTPGLWDRAEAGEAAAPIPWRTPLQEWLFAGFEEWAPSWDINTTSGADAERPLLGQLGHDDEAFSLLVVVKGPGAGNVRDELLAEGEMVCNVELRGSLVHRRQARAALSPRARRWGKTFDYCLVVDLERGDSIERTETTDPYSGYLWECVSPREWLGEKDVPDLIDAFFIWEHTDFANPDAREYGMDALVQKRRYVERRFGELALIQKSAPIVPGDPLLAIESFQTLIQHGS
jgi:hypothetical protein